MKIWFLLLATGTLLCAGCATETAEQRDQRINRTLQAFMIQAQSSEEQISGKARKDWGPAEIAGYNALFLGAIQDWTQAEHRQLANYDRMEPTARSTPAYVGGQSNYVPVQPQVNNQGSGVNPYNPYQHVNAGEHWGNPYNPYQNGW